MPLETRASSRVEYSAVGEGLGMRDFWLYVWLRRVSVVAAHIISLGLIIIISILSRPGTSELFFTSLAFTTTYLIHIVTFLHVVRQSVAIPNSDRR